MATSKIEIGKRYKVSFSPADLTKTDDDRSSFEGLISLQYAFKPSSVNSQETGVLNISSKNEVDIKLSANDGVVESFKGMGVVIPHEYVLLRDGDDLKLGKIHFAMRNLRHIPNGEGVATSNEGETSTNANLVIKKQTNKLRDLLNSSKSKPKSKAVSKKRPREAPSEQLPK